MSLDFLAVDSQQAIARSPMEQQAREAGARLEVRDGWSVAVEYGTGSQHEQQTLRERVGFADASYLGKLELSADVDELAGTQLELGQAVNLDGAWWCPIAPQRALLVAEPAAARAIGARAGAGAVDVTSAYGALTIAGPLAREVFARFCALDLRPQSMPLGGFRPGSVARTPSYVLCVEHESFLLLFGWAFGRYTWETVADAAGALEGGPVGIDALRPLGEALSHA